MNAWVQKLLFTAGIIFTGLSLVWCAAPLLQNSEKPNAIFMFGHWFDGPWELGFPSLVIGGLLVSAGTLMRRRFRRSQS